jgi:hypothetical protein
MKHTYFIGAFLIFTSCGVQNTKSEKNVKEIYLQESVKINVPFFDHFSDSLTYNHIGIFIGTTQVFFDSTLTEYLFDNKAFPSARKLKDGSYEILLKVFDAPDFNKTLVMRFKNNILLRKEILPYFESYSQDIDGDGIKEWFGTLHITEPPCNNCDSCYYNPILYYEINEQGTILDSALTVKMNKQKWGVFYGYEQTENIIAHCKY